MADSLISFQMTVVTVICKQLRNLFVPFSAVSVVDCVNIYATICLRSVRCFKNHLDCIYLNK